MLLPTSFFDTKHYFGLSFSQGSLKAVTVDKQGHSVAFVQQPLTDLNQLLASGDTAVLTDALVKLKQQGSFTTPFVSVVVPESLAFSKKFSLKNVTLDEFAEAISWQINEIFPFALDDIYYDWKLITHQKNFIEAEVVAIPKNRLDLIRLALGKAGLFPVSFEPAVSALARNSDLKDKPAVLLIDSNQHDTSLSLVNSGVTILTTTLNASDNGSGSQENMTTSINKILDYYRQKNLEIPAELQVVVTGEKADQSLVAAIENQSKLKGIVLDIPGIKPAFHQAYSAAASHVKPPDDYQSVNLLPKDLQAWYQVHYQEALGQRAFVILTTLAIAIFTTLVITTSYLSFYHSRLSATLKPPVSDPAANIPLSAVVNKANRINTLFAQKTGPQEELSAVIALVPPTITLANLSFDAAKQSVQIIGTAQTRDDLIAFKTQLEEVDRFEKVTLPVGVLTQAENINFTIDFSLKVLTKQP